MKKTITLLVGAMMALAPSSVAMAPRQVSLDRQISALSDQIAAKMSAKRTKALTGFTAVDLTAKMPAKHKTTIAVVDFTDLEGKVSDFGRFLAEELITRL